MRKVPMRGGKVVADLLAQMQALGPDLDAAGPELAGQLLPQAAGLLPAVTAGAGPLFQVDLGSATPG
jgi:hypothetical protein